MLKLEKASRKGGISVIVRDKESFFTQPFALAFSIAIAIHLSLVILFHVAPFKIGTSDTIFPPTSVEADATLKESAIAEIKPLIQMIRGLPSPPSSHPSLLNEPTFLSFRPIEYSKAENLTVAAFNHIETSVYQPEFHPLVSAKKRPLEIIISGMLAEIPLVSNGLSNKTPPSFSNELRASYSVIIEGRTGKIFWFESTQDTKTPSIDKFAEMILREMTFAADPKSIAVSGEIELHFNQGIK